MKLLIVAVCYNAYKDAMRFLESLSIAHRGVEGASVDLHVVLCDNSTLVEGASHLASSSFDFDYRYHKKKNIGYFPAFSSVYEELKDEDFDVVIVSNVDLVFRSDFFRGLLDFRWGEDVGVIAPAIISNQTGGDINPKILKRPAASKLRFVKFLFSFQPLYRFYTWASVKKAEVNSSRSSSLSSDMYAAHGSVMIFTSNYFSRGASIAYPRFLFGEEVFVAEEARRVGLRTVHAPSIVVIDDEHGSTSKANHEFIAGEHVKSYEYLLRTYFDKGSC